MADFVTQKECEARRAGIAKDYDALAERVRLDEIDVAKKMAKMDERLRVLLASSKILLGVASTVLASLILLIIKGALHI